jgi:hypothetical protein
MSDTFKATIYPGKGLDFYVGWSIGSQNIGLNG